MDLEIAEYRRNLIERYRVEVEPLFRYLPWLMEKRGAKVSSTYTGSGLEGASIPFPVYDATLMGFVKMVQRTSLTDRNYVYLYTRNHIRGPEDERRMIAEVTIKDTEVLTGILSHYILGGMTKGYLWPQAVEEGIYADILLKFKELFTVWDKPVQM